MKLYVDSRFFQKRKDHGPIIEVDFWRKLDENFEAGGPLVPHNHVLLLVQSVRLRAWVLAGKAEIWLPEP